jgi:glycosyltransferase involved in cell wall biosynthesis
LASNVGGIPEVIQNGINGFTFEAFNFIELEEKVIHIFNNREELNEIKEKAYRTILEKFDLRSNVRLISLIFEKSI